MVGRQAVARQDHLPRNLTGRGGGSFVNNEIDSFDIGPDPDAYKRASAVQDATIFKAESVKDPDTFNTGWKELNNDWLSGPFKVESFDKTQKVLTLVPNDKWWGDKPLLDKITFRAISPDAAAAAFVNNELDSFDIGPDPDAYKRVSACSDATRPQGGRPELPAHHLQQQVRCPVRLARSGRPLSRALTALRSAPPTWPASTGQWRR